MNQNNNYKNKYLKYKKKYLSIKTIFKLYYNREAHTRIQMVGGSNNSNIDSEPDTNIVEESLLTQLLISNIDILKKLIKDYNKEVAGFINKDNIVQILGIGTKHSVDFPINIEKDENIVVMFHTHPTELVEDDGYYFQTENDMFESIRMFFNSGKKLLNNCVINKYGIVNLKITTNNISDIKSDDISYVVSEIRKFAYDDYPSIWIKILGDNGILDGRDFNIAEEQYKLLTNHSEILNFEINKKLHNYKYINKINIELRKEYDFD